MNKNKNFKKINKKLRLSQLCFTILYNNSIEIFQF